MHQTDFYFVPGNHFWVEFKKHFHVDQFIEDSPERICSSASVLAVPPSGGYYDVARTERIQVGETAPAPTPQPTKPVSPLDKFRKKGNQASTSSGPTSFSANIDDPSKLYIYVYALNYKGDVSINGKIARSTHGDTK